MNDDSVVIDLAHKFAKKHKIKRRTVLQGAAAGTAAACLPGMAKGAQGTSFDKKTFLLDRLGFGRDEVASTEYDTRGGYTPYLDWQLDIGDSSHDDGDAKIAQVNAAQSKLWGQSPADIFWDPEYYQDPCNIPVVPKRDFIRGVSSTTLAMRSFYSTKQLQWAMAEFWQDHMLTTYLGQPGQYLLWLPSFRDSLLPNALGNYTALVAASATSGSMLWYLNLYKNIASAPDENYARELLELHTVGVDDFGLGVVLDPSNPPAAGEIYNQTDVQEAARLLTGWSIDLIPGTGSYCPTSSLYPPSPNQGFGRVTFNPGDHDTNGKKRVLGVDYDADGSGVDGALFIQHLTGNVGHPVGVFSAAYTALHVSARIVKWFIGDDFAGQFFNVWLRTALAFFNSSGNIGTAMRELFNESLIDELRPAPYLKMRRPLNLVVSMLRAIGKDNINFTPGPDPGTINSNWVVRLFGMGQAPGYRAAPNGYPSSNAAWQGTLLARENFIRLALSPTAETGIEVPDSYLTQLFAGIPATTYVDHVNQTLLGGILPQNEVAALQNYVNGTLPFIQVDSKREALIAAFSAPSYQYLY